MVGSARRDPGGARRGERASLADVIGRRARETPDRPAFFAADERLTWAEYDARSDALSQLLVGLELERGERVAVLLPDGPGVHVAYVAAEKAGLTAVGIGPRAGFRELRHLLELTGATCWITRAAHLGRDLAEWVAKLRADGLGLRWHLVVEGELAVDEDIFVDGSPTPLPPWDRELHAQTVARRLGPDDVFLLNTPSGTTGLPKCVMHDQSRWLAFHRFAVEAGALSGSDVFLSAVPAPFGFGIWTAHVTPALLGSPTVVLPRFSADAAIEAIERHRVTVLAAVSTQFLMMLDSKALGRCDLGSLRVLFTGGEAVPAERAAEFEERTGARVLQFYGSNEVGAVSRTSLADSREV